MSDFILQQTDAEVQAILNRIQPLIDTNDIAVFGFGYGTCATVGGTAAKTVSITNTIVTPGGIIAVLFQNAFTATNPTLSVNGSTAKPIKLYGNALPIGKVKNNTILVMAYDGTQFNVISIESQVAPAPTGFVDLALPSGLLWAEKNVGANRPEDDGLYFSWGNVDGHTATDGYDFGSSNDGPYASTPGAALTGNIPVNPSYDMALHNEGSPCRLPTSDEFVELYNNCSSEWVTVNGVNGRRFTSRINGNCLFFPASGYRSGTSLYYRGSLGYYWSSSLASAANARYMRVYSTGVLPASANYRFLGFSVRAVQ
jgi:hypothetical protein